MDVFWFWLFLILLLFAVLGWPSWPHTRERWVYRRGGGWRYAPSGVAALLVVLLLILLWLGLIAIAIAWPWYAAPVAA